MNVQTTTNDAATNNNTGAVNAAAAIAADAIKKARRTPEQAREARLAREAALEEKQQKRAARLKAEAEAAEKRAQEIAERKAKIAANVPVVREKKEVPTIGESRVAKMTKELKQVLKEFGDKHGVTFEDPTPRLTNQGQALSLRIVAHPAQVAEAGPVQLSKRVVSAVGATPAATRFIQKAKTVGIRPALLGKNIQLAGDEKTYKVMGLKGGANDVVLQDIAVEGADGIKTVSNNEFKTKMVTA